MRATVRRSEDSIDIFAMADANDQDAIGRLGIDHPVVPDAVAKEPSEIAAERKACVGMGGKVAVDLLKQTARHWLIEPTQIAGDGCFVGNLRGQAASSTRNRR